LVLFLVVNKFSQIFENHIWKSNNYFLRKINSVLVNFSRVILRWFENNPKFSILVEKYFLLTYFFKRNGIRKDANFIISLTTIENRFSKTWVTIECMLRQKVRSRKIVLWVDFDINLDALSRIQSSQLKRGLEIRKIEDIGPHTKYFYAFQEFKELKVITVDDDVIYPSFLTKDLIDLNRRNKESICCTNAITIEKNNGRLTPYNSWSVVRNWKTEEERFDLIPLGVGGVLYDPLVFPDSTFDKEEIKSKCLKADDIWLRMQSLSQNISVVRSLKYNYKFPTVSNTQEIALLKENVGESKNDQYLSHFQDCYLKVSNEIGIK
jgi:hypothetical protein